MESDDILERRDTKAYPLFLEELASVYEKFHGLRGQIRSIDAEQAEQLKILAHRFKGSAGFFGHQGLGVAAGGLEDAFLKLMEGDSSDVDLDSLIQNFLDIAKETLNA